MSLQTTNKASVLNILKCKIKVKIKEQQISRVDRNSFWNNGGKDVFAEYAGYDYSRIYQPTKEDGVIV